jgi:hypothetical protein
MKLKLKVKLYILLHLLIEGCTQEINQVLTLLTAVYGPSGGKFSFAALPLNI